MRNKEINMRTVFKLIKLLFVAVLTFSMPLYANSRKPFRYSQFKQRIQGEYLQSLNLSDDARKSKIKKHFARARKEFAKLKDNDIRKIERHLESVANKEPAVLAYLATSSFYEARGSRARVKQLLSPEMEIHTLSLSTTGGSFTSSERLCPTAIVQLLLPRSFPLNLIVGFGVIFPLLLVTFIPSYVLFAVGACERHNPN
jgi:hypothetical protein